MNITINEAQAPPVVVQRGNRFQCFLAGMLAGLMLALALFSIDNANKEAAAKNAGAGKPAWPTFYGDELHEKERLYELITVDDKGDYRSRSADLLPKLLGTAAERKPALEGDAAPWLTPSGPGK